MKSVWASGIFEFNVPSPIPFPKKPPSIIASDAFSACEKLLEVLSKKEYPNFDIIEFFYKKNKVCKYRYKKNK